MFFLYEQIGLVLTVEGGFGGLAGSLDSSVFLLVMYSDLSELTHTGTCRDEVTADDVLFHALQVIDFTADSGFVEYLSGLLEGGSRHEGFGTEGSTCDTL